jgi:predicted nucleic acid-binding protein
MVKLVVDEDYSSRVRNYMFEPERSWRVCTSFCFAEALGALKLRNKRGELSDKGYLAGSRKLIRLVREQSVKVLEGDFSSLATFAEAERIVKDHEIDFLDAFQLLSVKNSWRHLASSSQPLLVTADGDLSKAAESEGVKCWYCRETHQPKC